MPHMNPVGPYPPLPLPNPQWPPSSAGLYMPPQYAYNPMYPPKMEGGPPPYQSTVLHALPSLTASLPYALHPPPLTAPSTLSDPLRDKIMSAQQQQEQQGQRTYYAMQCDNRQTQQQQMQMQQYGGDFIVIYCVASLIVRVLSLRAHTVPAATTAAAAGPDTAASAEVALQGAGVRQAGDKATQAAATATAVEWRESVRSAFYNKQWDWHQLTCPATTRVFFLFLRSLHAFVLL